MIYPLAGRTLLSDIEGILGRRNITLSQHRVCGASVLAPIGFKPKASSKCGPGHGLMELLVPDKLYFNRTAACKVHDFMYEQKMSRDASDLLFLYNMNWIVEQKSKRRLANNIGHTVNKIYYFFVHKFGGYFR